MVNEGEGRIIQHVSIDVWRAFFYTVWDGGGKVECNILASSNLGDE